MPLELELTGGLVCLRAFTSADAPAVFAACADPQIRRFTSFSEPETVDDASAWIASQGEWRRQGQGIDLAIVPNATDPAAADQVVGAAGLTEVAPDHRRAEIGYWVAPQHRRRGYATAALELLSRWALGPPLDLVQLNLNVDADNLPSRCTAERAGYRLQGIVPSGLFAKSPSQNTPPRRPEPTSEGRVWTLAQYALSAPLSPAESRIN